MTLSQVRLRIGAVVAALGLAAINLDSILVPIIQGLGLPESILTLPLPVKLAVVIVAAVYALIVAQKASEHNPDGTDASKPYDAGRDGVTGTVVTYDRRRKPSDTDDAGKDVL